MQKKSLTVLSIFFGLTFTAAAHADWFKSASDLYDAGGLPAIEDFDTSKLFAGRRITKLDAMDDVALISLERGDDVIGPSRIVGYSPYWVNVIAGQVALTHPPYSKLQVSSQGKELYSESIETDKVCASTTWWRKSTVEETGKTYLVAKAVNMDSRCTTRGKRNEVFEVAYFQLN